MKQFERFWLSVWSPDGSVWELRNIYHHHPESKKRKSSEADSGSIHPHGRYGNAGKTRKAISTIAILWPVKAIFEKRAAMVEVDTLISPVRQAKELCVFLYGFIRKVQFRLQFLANDSDSSVSVAGPLKKLGGPQKGPAERGHASPSAEYEPLEPPKPLRVHANKGIAGGIAESSAGRLLPLERQRNGTAPSSRPRSPFFSQHSSLHSPRHFWGISAFSVL